MESDNYKIAEFLHASLGELLRISLLDKKNYEKFPEQLNMAMEVYQKYLDIIGDVSGQFKPKLN